MNTSPYPLCTAFKGHRRLAAGPLDTVALSVKKVIDQGTAASILVFEDATGSVIDLDLRGSNAKIISRLPRIPATDLEATSDAEADSAANELRGRGRPKLGVIAREVTLLPRHWEWLGAQPGGASITLRKLVESARRSSEATDCARRRTEAAYKFMSAMAGDLAGFEEATRSLFANDRERLESFVTAWPADVRAYVLQLAYAGAEEKAEA